VVPLRSSFCQSPDPVLPGPFPPVLTTMAFDHSHRRWFGTCSCQPVPRGRPSSVKQLHTLGPFRPFALVAHYRRHNAPAWPRHSEPAHRGRGTVHQTSADTGSPTGRKPPRPAEFPSPTGSIFLHRPFPLAVLLLALATTSESTSQPFGLRSERVYRSAVPHAESNQNSPSGPRLFALAQYTT
jgi:hypothetical protein